jgi:hypothetical protein
MQFCDCPAGQAFRRHAGEARRKSSDTEVERVVCTCSCGERLTITIEHPQAAYPSHSALVAQWIQRHHEMGHVSRVEDGAAAVSELPNTPVAAPIDADVDRVFEQFKRQCGG